MTSYALFNAMASTTSALFYQAVPLLEILLAWLLALFIFGYLIKAGLKLIHRAFFSK